QSLQSRIEQIRKDRDQSSLGDIATEVDDVLSAKALYRPPPKPARLGKVEESYREYRDLYNGLAASVDLITHSWAQASGELGDIDPLSTAQRTLSRYQTLLSNEIGR